MAQISVKYRCGSDVALSGIRGKVTAIHIRGRGREYEFSYIDNNGNPTCVNAKELELEPIKKQELGFK